MSLRALASSNPGALRPAIRTDATAAAARLGRDNGGHALVGSDSSIVEPIEVATDVAQTDNRQPDPV